ncbi:MAG: thioredoxin family protein [Anaerolineae bacterium]|nr:thioredoxin family protein [Anaerolineae bacterium]
MDIKVLGSWCHNCLRPELLVGQILGDLGIEGNLTRIEDPRQIDRYALTEPPGLVINGELVPEGQVPTREELHTWIAAALTWARRATTQ